MVLNEEQQERYSRHILLEQVGADGQNKINQSRVLIIGVGGLGSAIAYYLAAAGVGTIGIADGDLVESSNLQRQIIHFTSDLGRSKVDSAQEKIIALNPNVQVIGYKERLGEDSIMQIIEQYDFVVDATDNFISKFLINDACVLAGKPFSHGGILRFDGQSMTYLPGETCYRCVFKEPPAEQIMEQCSRAGVLGAVPGLLGTIQATEALKYILSIGEPLVNQLLVVDALSMRFRNVALTRNPECPVCGNNPTITSIPS